MGQQYSTPGDAAATTGSSQSVVADRRLRMENGDVGHAPSGLDLRNGVSVVMTPQPGKGELAPGEPSLDKPRMEAEVSRMSIRAAIDSFIENCLSTPTDDKTAGICDVSSLGIHKDNSTSRSSNSSLGDSDEAHSDAAGSEDACKNQNKIMKDQDIEDTDFIVNCDEKASVENEDKTEASIVKEGTCGNSDSCLDVQKETMNERSDVNEDADKKSIVIENSLDGPDGTLVTKTTGPEKQSFSAFLQDRLKRIDYDKQEELAQLALSKDIQCQGQMIMWEVARKPVTVSGPTCESHSSTFSSGPVRLQTLIDKVLDNSLNNQGTSPPATSISRSWEGVATQQPGECALSQPSLSEASLKEQQKWNSLTELNSASITKDNRLCFKDHIEKVLLESFLSYEEEEKKETLKSEGRSNGPNVETITDAPKSNSEGTISVQNIVDQVISQTEMISQLLAPSPRDMNKSLSSSGHSDSIGPSSGSSTQSNPGSKFRNISPQRRALLEAQRHAVQKEHQSSTNISRKRGRPQQNSTTSSSNSTFEPVKDHKLVHYDNRVQDLKSGQLPARLHNHSHPGPPPLGYTSQASLQYGIPSSITSLGSPQQLVAPSSTVILQRGHHAALKSAEYPSPGRSCLPPTISAYQPHPFDDFHQQREGQHLSSQVQVRHHTQPHHSQPHHSQAHNPQPHHSQAHNPQPHHSLPHHSLPLHGGHLPSSKAPPPLILADQVKGIMSSSNQGNHLMSHIPSRSCICHSCLTHFSRTQPHSTHPHSTHPQQRVLYMEQDRTGDPAIHLSGYNIYPAASSHRNSKDMYSQPVSTVRDTHMPIAVLTTQDMNHTYVTSQKSRQDQGPTAVPRGMAPGGHIDSHTSSSHYSQDKLPSVTKSPVLDMRFSESSSQVHRLQLDFPGQEADSSRRLSRDTCPHPGTVVEGKAGVSAHVSQAGPDTDAPLDLSVKPLLAHRHETRTCFDNGTDLLTQNPRASSPSRRPFTDQPARSKGQYVENEHLGSSGHHLQRLENSMDKLLLLGHPQPQPHIPLYTHVPLHTHSPLRTHHTHVPLQELKMSLLPTLHDARTDARGSTSEAIRSASQTLLHESVDPRTSLHSPVIYSHVISDRPLLQQQQPASTQHPRSTAPSPGGGHHQRRSPGISHGHDVLKRSDLTSPYHIVESMPCTVRVTSPTGYQRPPSLGPEQKNRTTSSLPPGGVSSPSNIQSSPSPEDQENQRLSVSKHEPIQNIIGSHPPSDILYLICRLCRQTYGSPYGFRKHFRNQHGFEPKGDHTIVQTISAIKSAMANTEPLDPTEESLLLQPTTDEMPLYDDIYQHSQSSKSHLGDIVMTSPGQSSLSNTSQPENIKIDLKKEVSEDTKCLECPECSQTFQLNDFGSYKRHCRQHNLHRSSGPFACHDCQRSFAEPEQLRDHLVTHSSFTLSLCGICQTFFSTPSYLSEHLQAAHGHTFKGEEGDGSSSHYEKTISHSERSVACSEKPSALSERSSALSERPSALSERPSALSERPSALSERPSAHSERPSAHSERPSALSERPSAHSERPSAHSERPSAHSERPSALSERPSAHSERPSAHSERPSALSERPSTLSERPSAHSERPSAHSERPSALSERPSTLSERPSAHSERPSAHSERPSAHSERPLSHSSKSADHIQKSEHLIELGVQSDLHQIRRASSYSGQPLTASSAAGHVLPISKVQQVNRLSPGDCHMFTVHTPKGLEIEKLPADGVVTTASPDSSYDEAKFHLDSQPGSTTSQRASTSADTQISSGSEWSSANKNEHYGDASCLENKPDNVVFNLVKNEKSPDLNGSRNRAESKCSDSGVSVDTNDSSLESSLGTDEADTLYLHKKYGRYRKRLPSSQASGEPETKSSKVEDNPAHRRSPHSVSSSANSGVTVQDCESSCPNLEDSSSIFNKPSGQTD